MPLMREELDRMKCGNPNCENPNCEGIFYLHSKCHPHRGVEAAYVNGVVTIRCLRCKAFVTSINVASGVLQ